MSLPPMEGARACHHHPCHHSLDRTPRRLAGGDDRAGRGPAVPQGAGRMGLVVRIVPPRQADRERGALLHVLPDGRPPHLAARHHGGGDEPPDAAAGGASGSTIAGPMSTPSAASSTCRGPLPAASASNTPASRPCGSWCRRRPQPGRRVWSKRRSPAAAGGHSMKGFTPFVRGSSSLTACLARSVQSPFCWCQTISTPIVTGLVLPSRSVSPTMIQEMMTRTPYRCAIGLMIKTDEISEPVRNGQPCGGSFNAWKGCTGSVYWFQRQSARPHPRHETSVQDPLSLVCVGKGSVGVIKCHLIQVAQGR